MAPKRGGCVKEAESGTSLEAGSTGCRERVEAAAIKSRGGDDGRCFYSMSLLQTIYMDRKELTLRASQIFLWE